MFKKLSEKVLTISGFLNRVSTKAEKFSFGLTSANKGDEQFDGSFLLRNERGEGSASNSSVADNIDK